MNQRSKCFDVWMKKHGEAATWQWIISALEKLPHQEALASKLKKKFSLPDKSLEQCQRTLTFSAMDEVLKELNQITDSFALLLESITSKAIMKTTTDLLFLRKLSVYLDHYLMVDGELLGLQSLDDLFIKIRHSYCFFNYDTVVKIVKQIDDPDLQIQLEGYSEKLELFKTSTTIGQLKCALEKAALPSIATSASKYNQVILKLNRGWKEHSVKKLEKLLDYIFEDQAELLANIKIGDGSVVITFTVLKSLVPSLISTATRKLQLIELVGVTSLVIGGEEITNPTPKFTHFSDALLYASQVGNREAVEMLVSLVNDVNGQNEFGDMSLHIASTNGHTDIVHLLLESSAHPDIQGKDGLTALMLASQCGHSTVVSELLQVNANVNIQSTNGCTAIMLASKNGNSKVATMLVQSNADVNLEMTIDGQTALILASQNGHSEATLILLNAKADP